MARLVCRYSLEDSTWVTLTALTRGAGQDEAKRLRQQFVQHERQGQVFAASPDRQVLLDLQERLRGAHACKADFLAAYHDLLAQEGLQGLVEAGLLLCSP